MHRLTLQAVTRANWRAALGLSVAPEQQRFVADSTPIVALVLAKAYVGAMGWQWHPYVFVAAENPIGFVALACEAEGDSVYWIMHFFIDERFQHQSYGREALDLLLAAIKQQHAACQAIHLTVHPENLMAQRLYSQAGFRPTGELRVGESVFALSLHAY